MSFRCILRDSHDFQEQNGKQDVGEILTPDCVFLVLSVGLYHYVREYKKHS